MAFLKNGVEHGVFPRTYVLNMNISSGTVGISINQQGEGFVAVDGSPFSGSSNKVITLGGGLIKAGFTDAVVTLKETSAQ